MITNRVSEGVFTNISPDLQPDGTIRDTFDGQVCVKGNGHVWMPVDGTRELPVESDDPDGCSFQLKEQVLVGTRTVWIAIKPGNGTLVFYNAVVTASRVLLTKLVEMDGRSLFPRPNGPDGMELASPDYRSMEFSGCFGVSDNNGNDFIYLNSGYGQPLCVPIGQKLARVSAEQCLYLPSAPNLSVRVEEVPGSLSCGSYAFSVQLFTDGGAATQWTMPTPFRSIGVEQWLPPTGAGIKRMEDGFLIYKDWMQACSFNGTVGGSPSDASKNGFKLSISMAPGLAYGKMRIACFNRGKNGASTLGYICYEGQFRNEITYTVKNSIRPILTSDIIVQPAELFDINSIDFFKDVQVAGGFSEFDGIPKDQRFKLSNGSLTDELKPRLSTVARTVPTYLNEAVSGTGIPRLYDLKDPVFAPSETYELAMAPVSMSGTVGRVVKIGTITMPDYSSDEVLMRSSARLVEVITQTISNRFYSQTIPSFPVLDIAIDNLDISMFSDPSVSHVELLFRNISNSVVGYGVVRTPICSGDENAGAMLPMYFDGDVSVFNSNLILNLPEHLFGKIEASDLKDMTIELLDCYRYSSFTTNTMKYLAMHPDYALSNYDSLSDRAARSRLTDVPYRQQFTIEEAIEVSYSNSNDVVIKGMTGKRRNATQIQSGDNCRGYGGKAAVLKLNGSYPATKFPWFGRCRIVSPLKATDNTNMFRKAGVRIQLSDCTVTERTVNGQLTSSVVAPRVVLRVGDRYARNVKLVVTVPNLDYERDAYLETHEFPTYSSIDVAYRVGAHSGTKDFQANGICVNRKVGYIQMENYSIHEHYVDAVPPFVWSCIDEELRSAMQQHVRWAVKRTVNSRYNELVRFLPNDIAIANLSGGRVVRVAFLSDMLLVVQNRAIGRMPYSEKVPVTAKGDIVLGTGKEFSSYYPIIGDGCDAQRSTVKVGEQLLVHLSANNLLAAISASTNGGTELNQLNLLSTLGVSGHPALQQLGGLYATPMINEAYWITIGGATICVKSDSSRSVVMGITSPLSRHTSVVNGKLHSAVYESDVTKMYVHEPGLPSLYGRPLAPTLTVVLRSNEGALQPISAYFRGLEAPISDIVLYNSSGITARGGCYGHDAMERRYFRKEGNGWTVKLPKARVNGNVIGVSGSYICLQLTFSPNNLHNFGFINEYTVNEIIKK